MLVLLIVTFLWRDAISASVVKEMTRQLNDGTFMPIVGLGTWKSPKGEVEAAVRHALCSSGYRHIDAAQIYQNQDEVGRGIRYAMERCGVDRSQLWVTSKIWNADFRNVGPALDRILNELGLDYLDQLLLHWPTPYEAPPAGCPPECPQKFASTDDAQRPRGPDGNIVLSDHPLSETWKDMQLARDSGKVRSIGVSNFSPTEIDELLVSSSTVVPAVNQVEAHVFWNQIALRKAMRIRNITLVAYSPLANPSIYKDRIAGLNSSVISRIANETGLSAAQVMLNFLTLLGDVVVPKSVTPSRIDANINFPLALSEKHLITLAKEAPQVRLANPRNRPGGRHVFEDLPLQEPLLPDELIRREFDEL